MLSMNTIYLWKGSAKLNVIGFESGNLCKFPTKIGCLGETLVLLDSNYTIWFGTLSLDSSIHFMDSGIKAVDFVCSNNTLYYLSDGGRVFKGHSENLDKWTEVVLFEEGKSCAHGHTTSSQHIFVKSVAAGNMGVLFLSDTGHLWVCGEHPQLDIHKDDEPTKVSFFEGRHITCINSGKDFNVVLTHKRESGVCPTYHEDQKSDDGNAFSAACPQCLSENIISPLSPQTCFDSCPLGLPLTNNTPSPSTPTSKNNTLNSEDRNNDIDNTSSSTEEDSCSLIRDDHSLSEAKEDEDSISVIVEKGDGMGLLHINTESARQFLTRQLSWMSSGGEELLAEVSVPTKIIKQNVSTVASFVYEGVKTVGDKVVTLSRHMSGGSDNNSDSFDDFATDDFNLSHASNTSSVKCEWSCSGGCSEVSDRGTVERLAQILARGARLVKTEVWTWGGVQHGQLGTGDMVKRHRPVVVNQLMWSGVDRVVCGDHHCLAITLAGVCHSWGANEVGQVDSSLQGQDQSSPRSWGRVVDVAAGARHSVLIASDHRLHWIGKYKEEMPEIELPPGQIPLHVLCSGEYSCIIAGSLDSDVASTTDLASEQAFLDEMLTVQLSVLKPLGRRSNLDEVLSNLASRYTDLLHLTAVSVNTMTQGVSSFKLLQEHIDEFLQVYELYLAAVCDMIAMSGFSQMARVLDIPAKLTLIFSDRLPSRKTSPEAILHCAFTHPLNRVSVYKMMLSRGQSSVPAEATKWEEFCERQDTLRKQADSTRLFWESCGRLVDTLRTPGRRLVRESRSHPVNVPNVSRWSSSPWLILLSDTLVHVSGGSHTLHQLDTVWVEALSDTDTVQNSFLITTPEETLTLVAPSANDKVEWLHAIQNTIKTKLNKLQAPSARSATYTFTKHITYKDATYTGRWVTAKMEGQGRLQWADGKVYTGQFHCNLPHGSGRLETPGVSVYEGQWKDGLQNGLGSTKYENGDVYEGYYKDGLASGHGVRKSGSFKSNTATVYVGEWVNGLRQGYGVMDDIFTGEKYLGNWGNNLKNGNGLIVTLEGIYYEGTFVQDVLTGHGVMVFEDGTHYEGELRAAGQFSGKGTLTFNTGDTFEGSLHGTWNEGIKINGTLHKNLPTSTPQQHKNKPSSFGKLCVPPQGKWKAIFRQCWSALGAVEGKGDTQRAWDNIAVALTSHPASQHRHHESLQTIPQFGRTSLDTQSYHNVCAYLNQAFESTHHPLGIALRELTGAFNATYGGRVHLLLLSHAVDELHSIADRLYQLVRLLFPALPLPGRDMQLTDNENLVISLAGILHPILLPRFHSALFELYALYNKAQDDCYWKRLIKWNKQPNSTLLAFLGIDRKFWFGADENQQVWAEHRFSTAVETLQQLKTTFCPLEKLMVIQSTFKQMTEVVRSELGPNYLWTMDELFPVFVFVVVRACISQLGSEIHFVEDFMEPRLANGELGIMITTLKAGYHLILQEKTTIGS
ncbi:alsin [Macrosteles quadrilineatus]|uniref:alsin n=1 Tax=Macrosteles quadrilineatus TaxID=74068 RepID=UPI0023E0FE0D|nr:alsin [Macrosteles quadrilineatus]